jgi:hypothetical protein
MTTPPRDAIRSAPAGGPTPPLLFPDAVPPTEALSRLLVGLFLAVALVCFGLPWSREKYALPETPRDVIHLSQSGVQMAFGRLSAHTKDLRPLTLSPSERSRLGLDLTPSRRARPALLFYPAFLLAAVGALFMPGPRRWVWAGVWSGCALLTVESQFLTGFPLELALYRYVGTAFFVGLGTTAAALVTVAWKGRPTERVSVLGWVWPTLACLGIGALYGAAFSVDAVDYEIRYETQTDGSPWTTNFDSTTLPGWKAFNNAFIENQPCWHANLFLWLGLPLLALRRWPWAAAAGATALALGLSFWVERRLDEAGDVYRAGYWMWLGSMALLTAAAALGGLCRRAPRAGPP